ncbi:MAG: hypothetical protein BWY71_01126 [Planctomycetes bacterium ADurb.Bin412]|nr:MAG: hypothetical protein BWY71_01126 [Planctomycetes bacterium ADurb.Bin412]
MVKLGDVQGGALAGLGDIAFAFKYFEGLDSPLLLLGQQDHLIADADGAGDGDAGDDGAGAFGGEAAFDGEAEEAVAAFRGDGVYEGLQLIQKVVKTGAGDIGERADGGVFEKRAAEEFFQVPDGGFLLVGGNAIHFGQGDKAVADAQQGEDFQVLAGLGHDAVVGCDDEDDAVHAGGAGDHGFDEVFMAGNIDDADLHIGDGAGGETQVDGHAAFFFDFEPVGVAAGEAFDEGGFAVIDMAGGSERDVNVADDRVPLYGRAAKIS